MTALCPSADLAPGRPAIVRLSPTASVIVLRLASGVVAYRNACPHMGIELDWQPDRLLTRSGRYLRCTGHDARFDPATGLCVEGPCAGESLAALPVRERDGMVVLDA
jgi:nitrite reductase/ring-hydroxylating ferredoxin subunit